MKAYELLDSEDKWCKGNAFKDENNKPISVTYSTNVPDTVCKFCIFGAFIKCYGWDEANNSIDKVRDHLKLARSSTVYSWNDTHSYEDVVKLLKELDL